MPTISSSEASSPRRVVLICQQCGREFERARSRLTQGRGKFCSRPCRNQHLTTIRGKDHPRYGKRHTDNTRARIARTKRLVAMAREQRGEKHPGWKGGRHLSGGYWNVLVRDLAVEDQALAQKMAQGNGYIREHRLVMARVLGRPLTRQETVHHINGDRKDNRAENLTVMGPARHSRTHREIVRELGMLRRENAELKSLLAQYQRPS